MAVIRFNDGYNAVNNIFTSLQQSSSFTRTQEAFRQFDNKRIINSSDPKAWEDTFIKEEMSNAILSEQIVEYGYGYSHRKYSGTESMIANQGFPMIKRILAMMIRIFCNHKTSEFHKYNKYTRGISDQFCINYIVFHFSGKFTFPLNLRQVLTQCNLLQLLNCQIRNSDLLITSVLRLLALHVSRTLRIRTRAFSPRRWGITI